jgi:hypothetical protein
MAFRQERFFLVSVAAVLGVVVAIGKWHSIGLLILCADHFLLPNEAIGRGSPTVGRRPAIPAACPPWP